MGSTLGRSSGAKYALVRPIGPADSPSRGSPSPGREVETPGAGVGAFRDAAPRVRPVLADVLGTSLPSMPDLPEPDGARPERDDAPGERDARRAREDAWRARANARHAQDEASEACTTDQRDELAPERRSRPGASLGNLAPRAARVPAKPAEERRVETDATRAAAMALALKNAHLAHPSAQAIARSMGRLPGEREGARPRDGSPQARSKPSLYEMPKGGARPRGGSPQPRSKPPLSSLYEFPEGGARPRGGSPQPRSKPPLSSMYELPEDGSQQRDRSPQARGTLSSLSELPAAYDPRKCGPGRRLLRRGSGGQRRGRLGKEGPRGSAEKWTSALEGSDTVDSVDIVRWGVLPDAYSVVRELDTTDAATVFLGRQKNSCIVVKRIDKRSSRQPMRMHANEVRILGQLQHAHVVKMLGICDSKEQLDVLLEYCPGGCLTRYVTTGQVDSLLYILRDVASALAYMHGESICHLDVKCDNVLVDSEHRGRLCDFGTATRIGASRRLCGKVGTPGYRAPEVSKGQGYDATKADVFSLGKVAEFAEPHSGECWLSLRQLTSSDALARPTMLRCVQLLDSLSPSVT